ncbi:hypothetical protein SAMN05216388_102042 [Halorientalis persicus]|jgi:hypothetical protein|uniref:Uncharacterized protein n=1 Tax=Halorientalis persicus TaxID=1367881 RepID=A0A1H8SUG6_9EURY|nr:hypothetical protein [Halorientalis persicus]SEO82311.1 hypothetical protein SAMN05216388_102042 [Halorientalis persicus]
MERTAELRGLAADLREREVVADAWLAKSFTDRLLVVDLATDAGVPADLRERLHDHDLYGANEVYDTGESAPSFAGSVGDATRHQFVDVRTRGDHQSYVVE